MGVKVMKKLLNWFKELSLIMKIIVIALVLLFGSAIVSEINDSSADDQQALEKEKEEEKAAKEKEKQEKEAEQKAKEEEERKAKEEAEKKSKKEAEKKAKEEKAKKKEDTSEETSSDESNKNDEEDITWDDLKDKDKIIGKSDKDFLDISKSKPTDVRNDVTGNWRKTTISQSVDIEEYALSYRDLHMKEGEIHHIINFALNTTTWLSEMGGLLYVDIKEYVDKEEHDAKTLGSGMLLKSYVIYPDGDIEELDEF